MNVDTLFRRAKASPEPSRYITQRAHTVTNPLDWEVLAPLLTLGGLVSSGIVLADNNPLDPGLDILKRHFDQKDSEYDFSVCVAQSVRLPFDHPYNATSRKIFEEHTKKGIVFRGWEQLLSIWVTQLEDPRFVGALRPHAHLTFLHDRLWSQEEEHQHLFYDGLVVTSAVATEIMCYGLQTNTVFPFEMIKGHISEPKDQQTVYLKAIEERHADVAAEFAHQRSLCMPSLLFEALCKAGEPCFDEFDLLLPTNTCARLLPKVLQGSVGDMPFARSFVTRHKEMPEWGDMVLRSMGDLHHKRERLIPTLVGEMNSSQVCLVVADLLRKKKWGVAKKIVLARKDIDWSCEHIETFGKQKEWNTLLAQLQKKVLQHEVGRRGVCGMGRKM